MASTPAVNLVDIKILGIYTSTSQKVPADGNFDCEFSTFIRPGRRFDSCQRGYSCIFHHCSRLGPINVHSKFPSADLFYIRYA